MIRSLVLAAVASMGIATFVAVTPAQALPRCKSGYMCEMRWWADASHTRLNGWLSTDCGGNTASGGTRQGFFEFNEVPCG
ncbi:MAG: hypothetical protein ACJ72N_24775 [Labedaea sp.]